MTPEVCGRAILEIGPGGNPLSEIAPNIVSNNLFVSMDKSKDAFEWDKTGTEILGDTWSLPFRERVFDNIWLLNVYGDPDEYAMSSHGLMWDNETNETILPPGVKKEFEEMHRALKAGGQVVIMEWYTGPKHFKEVDFERYGFFKSVLEGDEMISFVERMGFSQIVVESVKRSLTSRWPPYIIQLNKYTT